MECEIFIYNFNLKCYNELKRGKTMRTIYEKFNLYIYIIIPILICFVYYYGYSHGLIDLQLINNYRNYKFDFITTVLGSLLTIYGFMAMLPENNFRKMLRKFNHDKIINNTILIGILASLVFIILFMFDYETFFHDLLFLIATAETFLATIKIFNILRISSKSIH